VFSTYPAEKSVNQDANDKVSGYAIENSTIGATTPSTGKFTSVTTPSVTATTTDLNLTPIGTGQLYLNQSQTGAFGTIIARDVANTSASARLFFDSSAGVCSIRNNGGNTLSFSTGSVPGSSSGIEQMRVIQTASAVNYVQVTGAATGVAETQGPLLSVQGSDTDINMRYLTKGAGSHYFSTNTSQIQFKILHAGGNVANRFVVTGSRVNDSPILFCEGTATNISMAFQPKGTGAIDLAAGSSGVNISNGGTVTAATRTAQGIGYSSAPTWSASAPTTAGGVTATGTTTISNSVATATITNGGTGYTVGNVLTFVGGTFTVASQITVTSVSAGVITGISTTIGGIYTVPPTNPISVTGGSGSGATFTLTSYGVNSLVVGNAGSGYIEQPTVTFSGGGGSGATAYASVGSGSIVRSLGSVLAFYTPGGEAFRINDSNASTVNYVLVQGSATNGGVQIRPSGSDTNTPFLVSSKGTSQVSFYTNTFNQEQFRISHTASAVNYVDVRGATAGNRPLITMQGSDANVGVNIYSKGTGELVLGGTGREVLVISPQTSAAANFLSVRNGPTGTVPEIRVNPFSVDTNVSMAFQSRGTGAIDLVAGSSGVNISNGGTVTALTRSNAGSGYTSIPSAVISAPTTAGGVQATVTIFMEPIAIAVAGGGTGYTLNDVLTVVGGTIGSQSTQVTVTAVSGGVITAVNQTRFGRYSVLPTNPVSVTGGTGTGATFNITAYALAPEFVITNAGSGYIEQPTITFSGGGGGSGAAATAYVGSGTIVRGIGSTVSIHSAGGEQVRFGDTFAGGISANYWSLQGRSAGAQPAFSVIGSDTNISAQYNTKGTGSFAFYTNSGAQLQATITHIASAVNFVQLSGGPTSGFPTISAQGSDTNIGLNFRSKGIFNQTFADGNASPGFIVDLTGANNGVATNYLTVTRGPTTIVPSIKPAGTDTNISMALQPKGTGAINLAAGSSGVNISNGGTVTAATRSAQGSGYTSIPTTTIAPPTTAGGVQAIAYSVIQNGAATIANGGTDYTVGNVLTMVGGTIQSGSAGTFTVASISGAGPTGPIATVSVTNYGQYNAIPTNPVTVTGGSGSGATLNVSYIYGYPVFTNNGSGYIEQPAVTITGGGGSGAAAYATVGSGTVVRSLGSTMDFHTPSGRQFQVSEQFSSGVTAANYLQVSGRVAGAFPTLVAQGSDTNIGVGYVSKGTGSHTFTTSAGALNQFIISHTASAVNYVQVTGGVTGSGPTISAQGSDATAQLNLTGKGGAGVVFFNNGTSTPRTFSTTPTASAVNYFDVTNAVTGSGPLLSALGTDTNIDIRLQTKGTGAVNLNTGGGTQFKAIDRPSADVFVQVQGGVGGVSRGSIGTGGTGASGFNIYNTSGAIRFQTSGNGVNEQFVIADTASAVNYVQVTGAATGGVPLIQSLGSDANIDIRLAPKGTGSVALVDSAALTGLRVLPRVASGDTFLDVQRAVGFVDLIASSGVTDGDIRFTPKGTGNVRFGTYTAGVLTPTGYIEIKDSSGTVRRLLVG
jgi:hypothetical protein